MSRDICHATAGLDKMSISEIIRKHQVCGSFSTCQPRCNSQPMAIEDPV